ncbi:MAG: response regulator [Bdellovibrio sp.]|nr:response regulator [Bdellovibrio sp.]
MNGQNGAKIKIIYLDDETMLLEVLGELLREKGFEVTTHFDSQSALQEMNSKPNYYDVALIDFHLPNTTGAQVLRTMADNHFFGIPFVALYSASNQSEIDEAFERLDLSKYKIPRIMKDGQNLCELPSLLRKEGDAWNQK